MPKFRAENVAMRFGDFVALKDVNMTAEPSEFITLLGPSGCGKTTLLNIIAGFLTPTGGRIILDGKDITSVPPERRDSAMCFQSYALFPHLSVRDNVAFGPRQKKVGASETQRRVGNLIDQMGLSPHAEKLPNALSGGQQQRVALARALAVAPGMVLFDEPLSNLDAKLRDQVRSEIRALQREIGFTAIYVTHDQAEALALSDKVLLLQNGVVVQSGAPRDIYFKPRTAFVADFIGAANIHRGTVSNGGLHTAFGVISAGDTPKGKAAVCWRPESARLGGDLRGRVRSVAFQGAFTDVFLIAGEETVRLQLPGGTEAVIGEEMAFSIAPGSVAPLDDEAA